MSGIYYPSVGTVETFSENFAYIGANPLIFNSTLYENIMYGNSSIISDKTILNYLEILDTFKEKNGYDLDRQISNKTLSSGQMQKIAFVRAMVSNADILLLDEATANIDEKSKKLLFELLNQDKITIINSTHLPDEFENIDNHLEIKIDNEKRIFKLKNLK